MCGRFYVDEETLRDIQRIVRRLDERASGQRLGDIHPSEKATVITGRGMHLGAERMTWGFPSYSGRGLLINARSETALEKRTFRDSVLHRRCVVPAKWFYEWDRDKNQVTFSRPEQQMIYLAGFYNLFPEGEKFVLLTTAANASMSPVHDRMPLILDEQDIAPWILDDGGTERFLGRTPPLLERYQEYEQQTLCLDGGKLW